MESLTIGMPHRGRLNVLANVVRKPLQSIFNEFKAGPKPAGQSSAVGGSQYTGSGDVKYHLGTSYDRYGRTGLSQIQAHCLMPCMKCSQQVLPLQYKTQD